MNGDWLIDMDEILRELATQQRCPDCHAQLAFLITGEGWDIVRTHTVRCPTRGAERRAVAEAVLAEEDQKQGRPVLQVVRGDA